MIPFPKNASSVVGARVRLLRLNLAISQENLAELASMHSSNLGKLERGQTNPSLDTLTRVARALDTTLADLVRGVTQDHVRPRDRKPTARDYLRELEARAAAQERAGTETAGHRSAW